MEPVIQLQIHAVRAALQRSLDTTSGDTANQQSPRLPWSAGDRIAATVEATRADGRMLLRIGDFVFDAPRPPGVEVDQHLTLRFLSGGDKPTFALESDAQPVAKPAADVEISKSAQQLDKVIRAVSSNATPSSGTIEESVPLLTAPSDDARGLASSLQKSVSGSGMFYESHVRRWAGGDWPLNRLMHEPQARAAGNAVSSMPARHPAGTENNSLPATNSNVSAGEHEIASSPGEHAAVASATFPQIRNQLELLNTGQLVWQGQLWPGQPMRLEIDEPPQSDNAEEQHQWTSRLHVQMPSLGGVNAELILTGTTLRVNLRPDFALTHDVLIDHSAALQNALKDAGIDLQGFKVSDGK